MTATPLSGGSARKIDRGDPTIGCPVELGPDGVWHVRGYAAGRALLRSTDTVQAGLGIDQNENLPKSYRRPVLYRDGAEHREHRRQTARFFTPKRVNEQYRSMMERVTDELLTKLQRDGTGQLGEISFQLAVEVTATIIGLTERRRGLDVRLDRFFPEGGLGTPGLTSLHGLKWTVLTLHKFLAIYLSDVRPSVNARRRQRRDDLISHLIDEGCTTLEILGECITIGAAGMVTTREFINVAAWHFFTSPTLADRYRVAGEPERYAILHELLRLEPVVGNLKRRTVSDVEVPGSGATVTIPAGHLVDVAVSAANLDPAAVGAAGLAVCPGRELGAGALPQGLSFGDGPHRCPGAHIAIQEADIFLTRLLALPGLRMEQAPRVTMNPEISGYELRGLLVRTG